MKAGKKRSSKPPRSSAAVAASILVALLALTNARGDAAGAMDLSSCAKSMREICRCVCDLGAAAAREVDVRVGRRLALREVLGRRHLVAAVAALAERELAEVVAGACRGNQSSPCGS